MGNIVVTLLTAGIILLAIVKIYRDKKNKVGCSGCIGCSNNSICNVESQKLDN